MGQRAAQQTGVLERQAGLPGEIVRLHGLILEPIELGGR